MPTSESKSNRRTSYRWFWLLFVLVMLGVTYTLFNRQPHQVADSAPGLDSTGMSADTANAGAQGLSANGPDWKKVDFKAPAAVGLADKDIRVSANKDYTIYKLQQNLLFVAGQPQLQQAAELRLQQIAAAINKRYQSPSVAVFVDTDSALSPSAPDKQLGIDRAIAVKEWLLKNGGFAQGAVTIQSRGQVNAVVSPRGPSKSQMKEVIVVAYRAGTKGTSR